jgi:uncharacterized SAM-binding protein YcdF (DUF218 family)
LCFVVALLVWELLAWTAASFLVSQSELASADVLVLLSGASNYRDRAQHAATLWQQRRASRILVTNDGTRGPWSEADQRNLFFYERSVSELQRSGVPAADVDVLPKEVVSTYEEAREVRAYAEANGVNSILVVTSSYHSRRALWTYRRVFSDSKIRIGLSPAGDEGTAKRVWWWLTISGWETVPLEYVKLGYYWIHYR